ATCAPPNQAAVGGLYLQGNVTINSSTISNNTSSGIVGGLVIYGATLLSSTDTITNSTISGNSAALVNGALLLGSGAKLTLSNTTIAFNSAGQGFFNGHYISPGVAAYAAKASITVALQSTLLANNTYGVSPSIVEDDLSTAVYKTYTIKF